MQWEVLSALYNMDPSWVEQRCSSGRANDIVKAIRCNVLTDNGTSCPLPKPQAYDHHEGVLDTVEEVRRLQLKSDPKEQVQAVNLNVSSIDYNQRGEYVISYDAVDSSGNMAETLHFAVIIQDIVPPVLQHDSTATVEAVDGFR